MERRPGGSLFDVGLQLERTHLAWNRTALLLLVDGLLVVRFSRHAQPSQLGVGVGVALALLAMVAWWYGRWAYAPRAAALLAERSPMQPRVILAFSRATTALLLAAIAIALTATF